MAIYQKAPRKGLNFYTIPENEGFFIEGNDKKDSMNQLRDYAKNHPEKWIYYYDCGYGPGNPIPTCKHIIEVKIFDKKPANILLFYSLYQEGCDGLKEIDDMSKEEVSNLRMKQMRFFYDLGRSFGRNQYH